MCRADLSGSGAARAGILQVGPPIPANSPLALLLLALLLGGLGLALVRRQG